jgi:hypothetical protein
MSGLCELHRSIDINQLKHAGLFIPGKVCSSCWSRAGDPYGEVHVLAVGDGVVLLAKIPDGSEQEAIGQALRIAWTPCRFGGRRPWFVCPVAACGRRCTKIYLDRGVFACRECHQLAYASQREPVRQRGLHKARKIRASLGGGANVFEEFPDRPKGMHWVTYERLKASHDCAASRCMVGLSRLASRLGASR